MFNSLRKRKDYLEVCMQLTGRVVAGITLLLLFLSGMGCALIKLKSETENLQKASIIAGHIDVKAPGEGPVIVAACSADDEKDISFYTVVHGSGEYELGVYRGDYYIFAYRDINSNLVYDAGEPGGQYGDPTLVNVPEVGVVYDINLAIPEKSGEIVVPHGTEISSSKPEKLYSRQAGIITDLEDERFSEENGSNGFWEPSSFFDQFGGAIYFLEEYDPEKIPILFIHGATGTPRGWQNFVDNLDRSRYQPWFFYYASGLRIDSMAYLLFWKLASLQAKHQFNKVYITAHSMGGLVARSFIVNYSSQFPYVQLFVSLATPWGGDQMAEKGVKQSPVVIPSWHDMQPQGDFIKSLYRKKLPESVSFHLFYGYRGNRNPFTSNNDGTITLSSLLDDRTQSEAGMIYGFNEDHSSILYSEKAIDKYNRLLDSYSKRDGSSSAHAFGYLNLHFLYDYEVEMTQPRLSLILHRAGEKGDELITFLNSGDSGKKIGPLPVGDYLANMVTAAAKATRKDIPVTIKSNATEEVKFAFQPDGVIHGCVTARLGEEDKFVGRPDNRYRSIDAEMHIQSINLKGKGVQRTLEPQRGQKSNELNAFIMRDDVCYNNCFAFFGLPGGEYHLSVEAEGYAPVEKKYHVQPGVPKIFGVVELTPE